MLFPPLGDFGRKMTGLRSSTPYILGRTKFVNGLWRKWDFSEIKKSFGAKIFSLNDHFSEKL